MVRKKRIAALVLVGFSSLTAASDYRPPWEPDWKISVWNHVCKLSRTYSDVPNLRNLDRIPDGHKIVDAFRLSFIVPITWTNGEYPDGNMHLFLQTMASPALGSRQLRVSAASINGFAFERLEHHNANETQLRRMRDFVLGPDDSARVLQLLRQGGELSLELELADGSLVVREVPESTNPAAWARMLSACGDTHGTQGIVE